MKRVVFVDYVRVFACFLVMLVHASENFYGAEGSTDMAARNLFWQMRPTVCGCRCTTVFRVWRCLFS